MSVIFIYMKTQ